MKKLCWTLLTMAIGLALAISPASAQNTICTGSLAAGSYTNLSVPQGASCTLGRGTTVTVSGNVTVAPGATLAIFGATVNGNVTMASGTTLETGFGATVNGNVLSQDANLIEIGEGSRFGANLSLVGTTGSIEITNSIIGGNLTIAETTGLSILVFLNTVGTNVVLSGNNVTSSEDSLIANTIAGSLTCVDNAPPPTNNGSPNTVGGRKVGQCAGL